MKKIFLTVFITVFMIFGCSDTNRNVEKEKKNIVVSTFAIYDIASFIAKGKVEVSMLIPPGKEIHSFEPTPKDIVKLKKAVLFIYSGAGLEPWVTQFEHITDTLDLSKYVKLRKFEHLHHHHHVGAIDPHYWLDFENMQKATDVITEALIKIVPKQKSFFLKQAQEYKKKLQNLDRKFSIALKTCKKKEIFVNHNAYSYLAQRYGFKVESLVGLSPDAKPSPKTVQDTIDLIKKEKVKVLFCESFENSSILKNIAKDTGVKVETLQPLANITADEIQQKLDYEQIMLQNLQKLQTALECNGI